MSVRLTAELQCQTCRDHPATYLAELGEEAWVACIRCREQAVRTQSGAIFHALGDVVAEPHGPVVR